MMEAIIDDKMKCFIIYSGLHIFGEFQVATNHTLEERN
jgi:hypothetical protein